LPVIVDLNAIFEIPVDETITATSLKALIGKTCDLVVNSGIQQADIGASATDVIKIVGGDVDEQTVYVMINPTKFYTEGVA
jgi:dihydroxyacetone kinase DhaKLM complex PTS-EIIA-like component DhaM